MQKVLRGQAAATGSLISPRVDGYDKSRQAPALRPAEGQGAARRSRLSEGFGVTLDCVNAGFREAVCQAAAAMLAQVGIRVQVRSSPTNTFFPRLSTANASFVEYGWTAAPDPWTTLNGLFRSFDASGMGTFNAGRYSNPKLDVLIDSVRTEPDLTKRRARVGVALRLLAADLPMVPMYHRTLAWGMRPNVSLVTAQRRARTALGAGRLE